MKKIIIKPMILCISLILLISMAACTLPSSPGNIPATPTMPLAIPVITAAPTEGAEETAVVEEVVVEATEEVVVPIEVEEEIEEPTPLPEEEVEVEEEPEATEVVEEETEATPTPEAVVEPTEEEEVESEDEVVSATPTAIPYVYTANPDPMVMFYGATNCYVNSDKDSTVSVVVPRGIALGAYRRNGNFYQVVHPTRPGHVCWVTGDTMRPNQTAYNLKP